MIYYNSSILSVQHGWKIFTPLSIDLNLNTWSLTPRVQECYVQFYCIYPVFWYSNSLFCPELVHFTPLQYSCLENPRDGGAWWAAVHGVARSRTRLSDFTFTFHFHALEKEMATHSSVLAWRNPGMGEPGGLLSMGSHRVGHDWSNLAVHFHHHSSMQ